MRSVFGRGTYLGDRKFIMVGQPIHDGDNKIFWDI